MDTRYFIDVSTSMTAGDGPVSGVVRVEREIARRLPDLMDCAFIVFDLDRKAYFECAPNDQFTAEIKRGAKPLRFPEHSRVLSFGLESNTKCVDTLLRDVRGGLYKFDSILYDMTACLQPQLSIDGYGEYLRGVFADLFWFVDRYLAISEHTKAQLTQFAKQVHLAAPPCWVFPLGCDGVPAARGGTLPAKLDGKRFGLLVSTIEARKNHYAVYRAWDRALEEGLVDPDRDRLVFVGRKGWGVDDLMSMIEANPRTRDSILVLSGLSDEQLGGLYGRARFCLQPSFDEGYGLPVAEALAAGKLCLCSTAGAIPEVAGAHARYIDPINILGWRDAIAECFAMSDAEIERAARDLTAGFKPTRWNDSAKALASLVMEAGR